MAPVVFCPPAEEATIDFVSKSDDLFPEFGHLFHRIDAALVSRVSPRLVIGLCLLILPIKPFLFRIMPKTEVVV